MLMHEHCFIRFQTSHAITNFLYADEFCTCRIKRVRYGYMPLERPLWQNRVREFRRISDRIADLLFGEFPLSFDIFYTDDEGTNV